MSDKLSQLTKDFEEARKAIRDQAKDAFIDAATEVFKEYEGLTSFAWRQYTPYFNDGDACVFSVHNYPVINGFDSYYGDEEGLPYGGFTEDEYTIIYKKVSHLIGALPDEIMQDMFGDHQKVTVNRDGKIETERYDHD